MYNELHVRACGQRHDPGQDASMGFGVKYACARICACWWCVEERSQARCKNENWVTYVFARMCVVLFLAWVRQDPKAIPAGTSDSISHPGLSEAIASLGSYESQKHGLSVNSWHMHGVARRKHWGTTSNMHTHTYTYMKGRESTSEFLNWIMRCGCISPKHSVV